MILTRSPLRISLGGGGTDLKSYYSNSGGLVVSAAIDKYVYVSLNNPFSNSYLLKYSKYESVKSIADIEHPIIRECLSKYPPRDNKIEIISMADIPAGTGLGSSSSFTTALLSALSINSGNSLSGQDLAELACEIEIDILSEPIGKQDQYASSFGGISAFRFDVDGKVSYEKIMLKESEMNMLESNLLLFYTGISRAASSILREQDNRSRNLDAVMLENLHIVKDIGERSYSALKMGNLLEFANLMNEHWEFKKERSSSMTTFEIDNAYRIGLHNGAIGGKLVGAGGGGFLMFFAEDAERLRKAMGKIGLQELQFKFDFFGTKQVVL
jgi:D-glycero-alpha-D-manno-heptose-7-phosphate kinase